LPVAGKTSLARSRRVAHRILWPSTSRFLSPSGDGSPSDSRLASSTYVDSGKSAGPHMISERITTAKNSWPVFTHHSSQTWLASRELRRKGKQRVWSRHEREGFFFLASLTDRTCVKKCRRLDGCVEGVQMYAHRSFTETLDSYSIDSTQRCSTRTYVATRASWQRAFILRRPLHDTGHGCIAGYLHVQYIPRGSVNYTSTYLPHPA
jgi:hypothetical protein